jgi:hypothetical protein
VRQCLARSGAFLDEAIRFSSRLSRGMRWRFSFLRPALAHDVSFFPFLLFLVPNRTREACSIYRRHPVIYFGLVPRVIHSAGYNLLNLTRASALVNCQSVLTCLVFRLASHAATSSIKVALSGIRGSRHWPDKTPSSDSAMSSQLPCLGV